MNRAPRTEPAPDTTNTASANRTNSGDSRRLRVCFITTEFHGLFKNGGIGTANTGLALALSQAGFEVTVAFADADENGPRIREGNFDELAEKYRKLGIILDFVPVSKEIKNAFDDTRSASYCVYLYLKRQTFDVVYFNDCGGHAFFSLQAKRVGVFRDAPRMYVVAHGPLEWVLELNSERYWSLAPIATAFLERQSAAMADALISPSQYLVDWMVSSKWSMPAKVLVIQNIVRLPDSVTPVAPAVKPSAISEIVFFGRLEVRKGIELFCDAIAMLNRSVDLSGIKVTFLGKFAQVAGLHSGMYVIERARKWQSSLRILSNYGQEEALAYLNRPGALAVIASNAENSPCVVAECLQLGVPFVATDGGGTGELVFPEDRERCLVSAAPQAMAEKLEHVLKEGQRPARLANSQPDLLAQWLNLTRFGAEGADNNAVPDSLGLGLQVQGTGTTESPVVSVCLTPSSMNSDAESLIQSLLAQNYTNLQLVLFDDGRDGERLASMLAAFESGLPRNPVHVLSGDAGDRGAQRTAAAAKASGEFLFFVEEGAVTLAPECIDTLVAAAVRTGADIVTALPMVFHSASNGARNGRLSYFPIGGCAELGGFENCFGQGVYLVNRKSFERCGGFSASCELEVEDWLFLATSVLAGLNVEVVPEPIFEYRTGIPVALDRSKAVEHHRRILGAYNSHRIEIFRHVIETIEHVEISHGERLRKMLEGVDGAAREIAMRVSSSFEPNSEDSLRGFVQFCVERLRVEEALDFALHNNRSLLSDLMGSAKVVAENHALDAVRQHTLDSWHRIALTDEVRERVRSVSPLSVRKLDEPGGVVAAYSIETGVSILKAAAVCPPQTRFVRVVAKVEVYGDPSVFLALVVSTHKARLRLSDRGLDSKEAFWWSEWVPVAGESEKLELTVKVLQPTDGFLDLHFLSKARSEGPLPEGKVVWESVEATIEVNGAITASAIESDEETTPIPRHVIERGVVTTENPEFPFPVYVPGAPTLLHPLPGRASLVRIGGAVPPGSKGIRNVVSIELADSHPVQFAAWIRDSSRPAKGEEEFTPADAFSGWFTVRDKFRRHSFTVKLNERATAAMDLYLATRVVEFPDVHFCHAVWHELLILK